MSKRSLLKRSRHLGWIATAILLVGCGPGPATVDAGYGDLLPPPLSAEWRRTAPDTAPADAELFGGGRSTRATYIKEDETCVVTITGDSPMMQGLSMPFSNPALVDVTGAHMTRVGAVRVIVQPDGEVQAFASNLLVQYTGSCSEQSKLAYVANTDFDAFANVQAAASSISPAAVSSAASSPVELQWDRTFGGPASDWAYALTGTDDGGVATGGRTESKGAGGEDVYIVRVDGNGELVWDRTFGGPATDRARAIKQLRDGGFAVAGATESKGAGEFDVWVLRLDADGALIWDRHFGGAATDWASAVVETRDGGLAVAAYTQITADDPYDFWVIKLDGDGALLWERQFGGAATDWASAIAETADGGLAVVGHTESQGAGDADLWVLKLDAEGMLLWEQTIGGSGRDYASAVAATADGGVVAAGMTDAEDAGVDIRLVKFAADGELVWDRSFGGSSDDWVRGVIETRDGGYAAAGYTMSQGEGLYDVWILKLDSDGELQWERTFGGAANEWARALVEMPDGGFAMAGDTWSKGAGNSDVWVLRLAPE